MYIEESVRHRAELFVGDVKKNMNHAIGSKTQVWETKITTEEGKLVCISRCTLAIVDNWQSL